MITTLFRDISLGTLGDDIGDTVPDPGTTPTTIEELLASPVRYSFLLDGDDDTSLNFPVLTVLSAGDGDDRIEEDTNFFSWGIVAPTDAAFFQAYGGNGNDTLIGGVSGDVLIGGPGDDQLQGGFGNDLLFGNGPLLPLSSVDSGSVFNEIRARDRYLLDNPEGPLLGRGDRFGADVIIGGPGNDVLLGGGAGTFIDGGDGRDTVIIVFDPENPLGPSELPIIDNHERFLDRFAVVSGSVDLGITADSFFRQDYDPIAKVLTIGVDLDGNPSNGGFIDVAKLNTDGPLPDTLLVGNVPNSLNHLDAAGLSVSSFRDDFLELDPTTMLNLQDTIHTGPGNDLLRFLGIGIDEFKTILGGDGNDTLSGTSNDDTLIGGPGNDKLDGGPGDDTIVDGELFPLSLGGVVGNYMIQPGNQPTIEHEFDEVSGDTGDDVFFVSGGPDEIRGGPGSDVLVVKGPQELAGRFGTMTFADFENTASDRDALFFSEIDDPADLDFVSNQATGDTVITIDPDGSLGPAAPTSVLKLANVQIGSLAELAIVGLNFSRGILGTFFATVGDDDVTADGNENSFDLRGGNDMFSGAGATHALQVDGRDGDDEIQGGPRGDVLNGGEGADTISGAGGDDVVNGDASAPDVFDSTAPSTVAGAADSLDGGDGNDLIIGGPGVDTTSGGAGSDIFMFGARFHLGDLILDFEDLDKILLNGIVDISSGSTTPSDYVSATQDGADTLLWIDYDGVGFGDATLDRLVILEGFSAPSILIDSQVVIGDPHEGNIPPVTSDGAASTPVNTLFFDMLPIASDVDSPVVTYALTTPPVNGFAFVAGDGSYFYDPNPEFIGADPFAFTVSDGEGGSDTKTQVVNVVQPNRPPVSMDRAYASLEDTLFAGDLKLPPPPPSDPDGDPVTHTLQLQADHGSADVEPDGSFTYDPQENFFGLDTFEFTVADDKGGENTYTAEISVADVVDTIDGTAGDDILDDDTGGMADINGFGGHDVLRGNEGNDTLRGGVGDDTLEGGQGDDQLNGGDGTDVASIDAALADILLEWSSGSGSITEKSGASGTSGVVSKDLAEAGVAAVASKDAPASSSLPLGKGALAQIAEKVHLGTDLFTGIERLKFTDTILAIDTDQFGDNAYDAVAMFNGAFDRLPSADELARFLPVTDAGGDVAGVAQAMLDFYVPGGIDNPTLVAYLYLQLFGVPAPQDQIDLYAGLIDDGTFTQATLAAAGAMLPVNVVEFAGLIADGIALPLDYH